MAVVTLRPGGDRSVLRYRAIYVIEKWCNVVMESNGLAIVPD